MSKIALVTGEPWPWPQHRSFHRPPRRAMETAAYRGNAAQVAEVVSEIEALGRKAVALQLDMSQTASFPAFADTLRDSLSKFWNRDSFDYLVNNAGHGEFVPIIETTEAQFDGLFDVHVKGVFFLVQALSPLIADGGRIVNFSTELTRFSSPGFAAYAAAKGAVETLTRYMAQEFGARGITVNTVAPGVIETDFGNGAVRDNPDLNEKFAGLTALGRVGLVVQSRHLVDRIENESIWL